MESVTSSGTTRYLVDTNRALAQVLAEYTPAGVLVASYVYADDLISMRRGGQTYYYHFDGLGSTRLLTDSAGAVTDTYDYDAFGNLIARTGTTPNEFLFTGQQYDANIGFYYLRARYYHPTTGRFTALDPFDGDPYAPMSLHKYLYAGDDPVNKVDPNGEQADLVGMMASISMIDILSKFATPSYAGILRKVKQGASLTFYSTENRIVYEQYGPYKKASYDAHKDVTNNWCTDENGKKYKPTPIEIGYKSEDVELKWITKRKSYGDGWTYIETFHPRGKDIHGGGKCKDILDPFTGKQGWCRTCGCIRMQNEDIRALSENIRTFKKTGSKVPFEVKQ